MKTALWKVTFELTYESGQADGECETTEVKATHAAATFENEAKLLVMTTYGGWPDVTAIKILSVMQVGDVLA